MTKNWILASCAALALMTACSQSTVDEGATPPVPLAQTQTLPSVIGTRPNVLIIVADDLGYSDLGIYGGEIDTPNIDALAGAGMMMTNFYAAGTCSPTRSMLMSGVDHHQVGLGAMGEHLAPNQKGLPGYEGYLLDTVITIADRLKGANYRTYMAGKWHLGGKPDQSPAARGFDESFVLIPGGASHFDKRGLNRFVDPAPYLEDGALVPIPSEFEYSTDFYTDKMISYLEAGKDSADPFFAYLAYTAPHWPLHARPQDMAKYKGKYDGGWDETQNARFARMKALGIIAQSAKLPKRVTDWEAWSELSDDERAYESKRMEIFAAMIDRLDQKIGDLVSYLKQSGQYDNTVVFFMSDNGSEGAALQDIEPFVSYIPTFDNSLESIGTAASYIFLEERWAQVSGTPLRHWKGIVSDGGIRVPAFVSYGGFENQGARYDGVASVLDIAPTLLGLAGIDESAGLNGRTSLPLMGKSMLPALTSHDGVIRADDEGLGWELFTRFGYRKGQWKALKLDPVLSETSGKWALYNAVADPGETTDVSAQHPQIMAQMISDWETYAATNNVIPGNTAPDR